MTAVNGSMLNINLSCMNHVQKTVQAQRIKYNKHLQALQIERRRARAENGITQRCYPKKLP